MFAAAAAHTIAQFLKLPLVGDGGDVGSCPLVSAFFTGDIKLSQENKLSS